MAWAMVKTLLTACAETSAEIRPLPVETMRSLVFTFVFAIAATPASAAESNQPPRCTAETLGAVSCMSTKLCECVYERGGAISGKPSGYRWECGALRPDCNQPGADLAGPQWQMPAAVGIDRSRHNTIVNQGATQSQSNAPANPSGGGASR